jgi:bifunctional DNA-binding transcriptional regulator/antitoxin component of YhaV-PrlF toxin-antitoxin module
VKSIRVTAKRQATLPVELCEELGIQPGDELELERRRLRGETVWILRTRGRDWSWLGAARRYAEGKTHRWEDIEKAIGKAMAGGDRRS